MTPRLQPITVTPRPPNARLWELHRKTCDRTATPEEIAELDLMCQQLEAEYEEGGE